MAKAQSKRNPKAPAKKAVGREAKPAIPASAANSTGKEQIRIPGTKTLRFRTK